MEINPTNYTTIVAYLDSLLVKYDLNLSLMKQKGYAIASFEDNQIFDETALKLSRALHLEGITQLYVYEYEGGIKGGFQGTRIETTQDAIEKFQNWEIFPESFFCCLLFDAEFRVVICRASTCETTYFCGSEAFVSYLTNAEICDHFLRE